MLKVSCIIHRLQEGAGRPRGGYLYIGNILEKVEKLRMRSEGHEECAGFEGEKRVEDKSPPHGTDPKCCGRAWCISQ